MYPTRRVRRKRAKAVIERFGKVEILVNNWPASLRDNLMMEHETRVDLVLSII